MCVTHLLKITKKQKIPILCIFLVTAAYNILFLVGPLKLPTYQVQLHSGNTQTTSHIIPIIIFNVNHEVRLQIDPRNEIEKTVVPCM